MPEEHLPTVSTPMSVSNVVGHIRSSWTRCENDYGLVPDAVPKPQVLTRGELQDAAAPIENLIALASPELQRLFDRLVGHGYLVSLVTMDGVIVRP